MRANSSVLVLTSRKVARALGMADFISNSAILPAQGGRHARANAQDRLEFVKNGRV